MLQLIPVASIPETLTIPLFTELVFLLRPQIIPRKKTSCSAQ
ncbi:Uncharacterised protein [Salmonella enterica]|nr:Uncharacterised protein [Salmonella enterica]